jgi:hypothetical protein
LARRPADGGGFSFRQHGRETILINLKGKPA